MDDGAVQDPAPPPAPLPSWAGGPPPLSATALVALLRRARDAFCIVSSAGHGPGRVVAVNDAFCTITGHTREAVVGRQLRLLAGPATDFAELRRLAELVRAGRPAHGTLAARRADGSRFWIEVDAFRVADRGGPVGAVALVARDVTATRHAAAELERVNRVLRLAATTGGVGIWEFDDTGWARWDDTYRRVVGVAPGEHASVERGLAAIHPDERAAVAEGFGDGYQGRETTCRVVHPDGSVRHVLIRGLVISEGATRRYTGTIVDITDTQIAAARVVDILESITDGYVAVDRGWRVTYLNGHAERDFQVRRADVLGRHLWDQVLSDRVVEALRARAEEVLATGRPVVVEGRFGAPGRWSEVHLFPLSDGLAGYIRDVTDRRRAQHEHTLRLDSEHHARVAAETAQHELVHQATHDALTGLVNRTELSHRVTAELRSARGPHPVVVLFLDLDRFKLVNDTLGHAAGDELLVVVARRLQGLVRPQDVVARLGGDEFVVALLGAPAELVDQVVQRLLQGLREPVPVQDQELSVTVSVGVCQAGPGATSETLLRDADVALYRAKDSGRDRAAWFDAATRDAVVRRVRTERDLRRAVDADELVLVHQPSFDLRTGRVTGVEALLRWAHPERGLVLPGAFVPVAEDSGLIVGVGEWVVDRACREAAAWPAELGDATTWVNVSPRQLGNRGLTATVQRCLAAHGVAPGRFGIEITETVLTDSPSALAELRALAGLGVRIAIDDFGTGYSSLARLRTFPVDVIKIDRSFVTDLDPARPDPIVDAVVHLAHALGTTTIAEGVENVGQLAALRNAGCDDAAGFLLARPVPVAQLGAAVVVGTARVAPRP